MASEVVKEMVRQINTMDRNTRDFIVVDDNTVKFGYGRRDRMMKAWLYTFFVRYDIGAESYSVKFIRSGTGHNDIQYEASLSRGIKPEYINQEYIWSTGDATLDDIYWDMFETIFSNAYARGKKDQSVWRTYEGDVKFKSIGSYSAKTLDLSRIPEPQRQMFLAEVPVMKRIFPQFQEDISLCVSELKEAITNLPTPNKILQARNAVYDVFNDYTSTAIYRGEGTTNTAMGFLNGLWYHRVDGNAKQASGTLTTITADLSNLRSLIDLDYNSKVKDKVIRDAGLLTKITAYFNSIEQSLKVYTDYMSEVLKEL